MADGSGLTRASSVSLGLVVVSLYVVFVTAVFAGFATYIYRGEWNAVISADDSRDMWNIDSMIFILNREEDIENALKRDHAERLVLEKERFELAAQRDIAFANIGRVQAEMDRQAFYDMGNLQEIYPSLLAVDQAKIDAIKRDGSLNLTERAAAMLMVVRGAPLAPDATPEAAKRIRDLVALTQESSDDLRQRHADHGNEAHAAKASLSLVEIQLERLEEQRNDNADQLAILREQAVLEATDRARMNALTLDVPIIGDVFKRLVSFPTIFLTLIVTMAAGGLGTVVAFSRRYYSGQGDPNMSRLFVNVGEGIAAAMAIFLFSGAGMLALTQGGGTANAVELSPYTVAFVAFLSGFMAEDAFGSIQSAGKRIFKKDDPAQQDEDTKQNGQGEVVEEEDAEVEIAEVASEPEPTPPFTTLAKPS